LKSITQETFVPIVLVTVKTDSQSRVEGLRIGADDYVCKPFDETELVARVGSMLRIKRLHDHVARAKKRLEQLSMHDELTGAFNYRYLHLRLTEEFKRAEHYHDPVACALVDIDALKEWNEGGGHASGDLVIRTVADAVRKSVRDLDLVARFGGDEFLVVMPSTHFAGSVEVAERISAAVEAEVVDLKGVSRPCSVSIGIALFPSKDVRTKDALLRAADLALFQAKREGGKRICVFQQQGYIYSPPRADEPRAPIADERAPRDG
jgi:diguanylate cyclase (GGDEF)-like protein